LRGCINLLRTTDKHTHMERVRMTEREGERELMKHRMCLRKKMPVILRE